MIPMLGFFNKFRLSVFSSNSVRSSHLYWELPVIVQPKKSDAMSRLKRWFSKTTTQLVMPDDPGDI